MLKIDNTKLPTLERGLIDARHQERKYKMILVKECGQKNTRLREYKKLILYCFKYILLLQWQPHNIQFPN